MRQSSRCARDKEGRGMGEGQTRRRGIEFRVGAGLVVPPRTREGVPMGGPSRNRVRPTL